MGHPNFMANVTAEDIAEQYSRVRAQAENLPPRPVGFVNMETMRKAATMCNNLKMEAAAFVEAQYDNAPEGKGFFPNMLLNRALKSKPIEYEALEIKSFFPEEIVEQQKNYLRNAITNKAFTPMQALLRDDIPLLAWFRIVITDTPVPEVIEKYRVKAKKEMYPPLYIFLQENNYDVSRLQ